MDAAEIDQARLAEQRTASARVRDFAAGLLAEHQRASERQTELMGRLDMAPVESDESARIRADAQKDLEALKAKEGAEFDETFLDMQVAAQHKMLDRIHDELIPKTQNEALKAELVSSVPAATADVTEVYDIRRDLDAQPVQAQVRGQ
jgi:putative membrane protein